MPLQGKQKCVHVSVTVFAKKQRMGGGVIMQKFGLHWDDAPILFGL